MSQFGLMQRLMAGLSQATGMGSRLRMWKVGESEFLKKALKGIAGKHRVKVESLTYNLEKASLSTTGLRIQVGGFPAKAVELASATRGKMNAEITRAARGAIKARNVEITAADKANATLKATFEKLGKEVPTRRVKTVPNELKIREAKRLVGPEIQAKYAKTDIATESVLIPRKELGNIDPVFGARLEAAAAGGFKKDAYGVMSGATEQALKPDLMEQFGPWVGGQIKRHPGMVGLTALWGSQIAGAPLVKAAGRYLGMGESEVAMRVQELEKSQLQVRAVEIEQKRLQRAMQRNATLLAATAPDLYNKIMAGQLLPEDALVAGGSPRQDLMEQLTLSMSQGQFSSPLEPDPMDTLLGGF